MGLPKLWALTYELHALRLFGLLDIIIIDIINPQAACRMDKKCPHCCVSLAAKDVLEGSWSLA